MKSARAVLFKLLGGCILFLGCTTAATSLFCLASVIAASFSSEQSSGFDVVTSLILAVVIGLCVVLAFFLIQGGRRLILRGRAVQQEVFLANQEEARIQQEKRKLEQIELENKRAEQARIRETEANAKRKRLQETKVRHENSLVFLTAKQIQTLEQKKELPRLGNCELILQQGEIAVYGCCATWSQNGKQYFGHLYITTERIGFVSDEKRFILDRSDLIAAGTKDNGLSLHVADGIYTLDLPRADLAGIVLAGLQNHLPISGVDDEEETVYSDDEPTDMNGSVFLTDEQILKLELKTELPRLDDCELILQQGEIAVYGCCATWSHNGINHFGHLYITTERIGFVSDEKRFILDRSDLIAAGTKDNGLSLHVADGIYTLDLPRADLAGIVLAGLQNHLPISGVDDEEETVYSDDEPTEMDVSLVDGMEGHDFEYYCAALLEKNGFSEVEVTKGSGDQGVDILAVKDGIKYAIQCKNYATKLGNTPIQEVNAGKTYYHCHVGVVMTNSTFTPAAIELAEATSVQLWDRDTLQSFMKAARRC